MSDSVPPIPADRKLYGVHRAIIAVLTALASVMTLLWVVELGTTTKIPKDDVTWFVSAGIRLVTFVGLVLLSFLATYRAQPMQLTPDATARPTPSSLRLRVLAGACGALFFGDLAASSFAGQAGSWVAAIETALLALLALAAVVAVATGRATLRLWREAGGDMPIWNEPTEAATNRVISSVGSQTVWLGVFLAAWLLSNDLPPIIPLATRAHGVSVTLILEGVAIVLICIAHYVKRELVLYRIPYDQRSRVLDVAMGVLGTGMSSEVGIRTALVYDDLPALGFWLGVVFCLLGLIAGGSRFFRSVHSQERRPD
ncbi:MAG: hypothetical protein JRF63_06215 [Deltaproteobacteria bacterium]|nr:hypothetical protein [Deltaproteobacteria bacterium]